MKSQKLKNLAYGSLGPLSALNGLRVSHFGKRGLRSRRPDGKRWVHLGSGRHYIQGMVNVDLNPFSKKDLWLDLRTRFPFEASSVDAIYCWHTLEHFDEHAVRGVLSQIHWGLKPRAGVRLGTPDFRKAAQAYLSNRLDYFNDFPDKRRSIGGRAANYLLCGDQHRLLFDFTFWTELLEDAGFTGIMERTPHESALFPVEELRQFEYESPLLHQSVIVEAFRK